MKTVYAFLCRILGIECPRRRVTDEEVDALVARDHEIWSRDPECTVGATVWEHDVLNSCPCI